MAMDIQFKNITDFDIKGKKILVRVDLNSSIDGTTGELRGEAPRIKAIVPTLEQLKDAAVVIIAHQGRFGNDSPKEKPYSLKVHAERLNEYLGGRVKFIDDINLCPAGSYEIQ